jgi:Tfp pilus assembly protein PilE
MTKLSKNESGFSVVELAVVVLIVAVIGGIGYAVHHNNHKNTDVSETLKKSATVANPYAGWKTFCDSANYYCFQYPANWKFTNQNSPDSTSAVITNPSDTASVSYNNAVNGDSLAASGFHANLIYQFAKPNNNLTIIGGYFTAQTNREQKPLYAVIDSSYLTSNPLIVGNIGQLSSIMFTDSSDTNSNGTMQLTAADSGGLLPSGQVNIWLNAKDTQTGLLILKSLKAESKASTY